MDVKEQIDNRGYYTRRAREERQIAVQCEDNSAALVHLNMAEEYDKRAAALGG
jgi:hypothetical protein